MKWYVCGFNSSGDNRPCHIKAQILCQTEADGKCRGTDTIRASTVRTLTVASGLEPASKVSPARYQVGR